MKDTKVAKNHIKRGRLKFSACPLHSVYLERLESVMQIIMISNSYIRRREMQ